VDSRNDERDDIARLIYRAWIGMNGSTKPQGSESGTWHVLADAILAAGFRVPTPRQEAPEEQK
jgi:hypothetical protein